MKQYKTTVNKIRLVREKSDIPKAQIKTSADAAEYVRQFYFDDIDIYESMFLVLLNSANNTEGYVKISQGGTAGTVVDIKLILKYAIESLSPSIILVHNHPSGNEIPSQADLAITKSVINAIK